MTVSIKNFRTDTHLVLIIALVLIKCIVLIYILYVRSRLVTGVVRLCLLISIRRIALWVVDSFVTVKNGLLFLVEVGAPKIMVVVTSRIVAPCLANTIVCDHSTHGINPLFVSSIRTFLIIIKSIETHIL